MYYRNRAYITLRFLFFIEEFGRGIFFIDGSPLYDLYDFSSKLLRDLPSESFLEFYAEFMCFMAFVVLGLTDKKFLSTFYYSFYISYVYFFSSGSLS